MKTRVSQAQGRSVVGVKAAYACERRRRYGERLPYSVISVGCRGVPSADVVAPVPLRCCRPANRTHRYRRALVGFADRTRCGREECVCIEQKQNKQTQRIKTNMKSAASVLSALTLVALFGSGEYARVLKVSRYISLIIIFTASHTATRRPGDEFLFSGARARENTFWKSARRAHSRPALFSVRSAVR